MISTRGGKHWLGETLQQKAKNKNHRAGSNTCGGRPHVVVAVRPAVAVRLDLQLLAINIGIQLIGVQLALVACSLSLDLVDGAREREVAQEVRERDAGVGPARDDVLEALDRLLALVGEPGELRLGLGSAVRLLDDERLGERLGRQCMVEALLQIA